MVKSRISCLPVVIDQVIHKYHPFRRHPYNSSWWSAESYSHIYCCQSNRERNRHAKGRRCVNLTAGVLNFDTQPLSSSFQVSTMKKLLTVLLALLLCEEILGRLPVRASQSAEQETNNSVDRAKGSITQNNNDQNPKVLHTQAKTQRSMIVDHFQDLLIFLIAMISFHFSLDPKNPLRWYSFLISIILLLCHYWSLRISSMVEVHQVNYYFWKTFFSY